MFFNRYNLLKSINNADNIDNIDIYRELLSVWYKLIDQESISGKLINEFFYYDNVSDSAVSLYRETANKKEP